MPFISLTYHSRIFRDFKEIDAVNHRRIIRFYEDKEEDIKRLDFDEYFQLIVAYVNALFELGLIRSTCSWWMWLSKWRLHNVKIIRGGYYQKMLFRKSASV